MNAKNAIENIMLFDDETDLNTQLNISAPPKLEVIKAEFIEIQNLNWEELFSGFDKLYAITYSSSVDFLCKLLKNFETAEIIFGFEPIMSNQLHEIFAYQDTTVKWLKEKSSENKIDLISRVENNSLKMYAARDFLSHEKIYMLESNDGGKRVITGSANLSNSAFIGKQRENLECFDSERLYHYYRGVFENLKESCADNINSKSLLINNDSESEKIEELPISRTVILKKALVIEPQNNISDEIKFALDIKNASEKYRQIIPKKDKDGKIKLFPETIKQIGKKLIDNKKQEKERTEAFPQLIIDYSLKEITLNGSSINLHPVENEIAHDVSLFLEYMDGYDKFHGDTLLAQMRYFEFANWFFVSPFMAVMRDMADKYNHNLLPYPVFGLLYGQSKAGKTTFLETLLKMMIGQKPIMGADKFNRSNMKILRHEVKGAPIIVDDLTSERFREHAVETIKNDKFGTSENLLNYPAVAISANDDVTVAPEIVRRAIVCNIQIGRKNTELMKSNIVRRVQKNIGTAFYCEYLRRMIDAVADMLDEIKSEDNSPPDILYASSQIIIEIFSKHYNGKLPEYIRELTLDDYFSEKVTGAGVIKTLKSAWAVNPKAFIVDTKRRLLSYNAAQTWEAARIIKELPEDLEAHRSREWVIMNLNQAREFFSVDFRKKFWQ